MLGPDYILRLSEGAEQIASDLHDEIIKRIIERIMLRLDRGDDYLLTAIDKWQLDVLQEAGYLREELQKEIAKKTKLQHKEIKAAFEDAGIKTLKYDDEVYKAAGISPKPLLQSPYLIRLLQRGYEATDGEWYNYTKTIANKAQQTFIRQCDKAYSLVASGAMSYSQAVTEIVKEIAATGVKVTYPSGHEDTIETATIRAVRTGVSQSCADITQARMDEYGWDIVLVSAHLGARYGDGGDNFTNHFWWQGKFYSRSGKDERFPPFSVCGEGDIRGIFGANCRHSMGPGDGINNPYKDFDSEENKHHYDLEQKQRAMERRIRDIKRECIGLKTAVDNAQNPETKLKLEDVYRKKCLLLEKHNLQYNSFCLKNGLARQAERLQTAQWDRVQAKAALKAVNNSAITIADIIPQNTGLRDWNAFDASDLQRVAEKTNIALDNITTRPSQWSGKIYFGDDEWNKNPKRFKNVTGETLWNGDIRVRKGTGYSTILHEMLHTRSVLNSSHEVFVKNQYLEEGTVQFFNEQICEKYHINCYRSYRDRTEALYSLYAYAEKYSSRYAFARALFEQPLETRLEWLKAAVSPEWIDEEDKEYINDKIHTLTWSFND